MPRLLVPTIWGVMVLGSIQPSWGLINPKFTPLHLAYLQVDRDWYRMSGGQDKKWGFVGIDTGMQGTWDGGTDMLIRAVEYILKAAGTADVPVAVGVTWASHEVIGKVEGIRAPDANVPRGTSVPCQKVRFCPF